MNTARGEQGRHPRRGIGAPDREGFALEATLMMLMLFSGLVLVLIQTATGAFRTGFLDYTNSRAFYAAEAGAEAAMGQVALALEDAVIDDEEVADIHAPELEGFSFDSFRVRKIGDVDVETITDGPFAGLYSLTQKMEVYSEAREPAGSSNAVLVSAKAQAIPIFQFGVFFEKDIEFTNAPEMHFEGRIHSNGNLYFSSGRDTYFHDLITTPNKAIWNRKDRDLVRNHTLIHDASGNPARLEFDSRSHPNPGDFRARSHEDFDDRLKTNAYGVDSLNVPLPPGVDPAEVILSRDADDTEMEKKAKFAWKADMYVTVDLENRSTAGDVCGDGVPHFAPNNVSHDDIGVTGDGGICPGRTVTFTVSHPDLECSEFDERATLKEVSWGGDKFYENDPMDGCQLTVTLPSGNADDFTIKIEIKKEDYAQLDEDQNLDVKWEKSYIVDNCAPGEGGGGNKYGAQGHQTPWPTITVERSDGKQAPGQDELCNIFFWTWDAWYDPREENFVDQIELDVAQLYGWIQADPGSRSTSLLYVDFVWEDAAGYPDPASDGLYPALRVADAANLQAPVTFATNNPLYVLGDYNTGTWQPSALVGDAITTLSNGWDDAEHQVVTGDNEETNAASTAIYAAVLAGHDDTDCDWYEPGCSGGNYGGGVHSFVRYIEDWTYDTYTFRGSLVSLHVSRVAQGQQSQTFYEPPIRDIRFDTRFQDPENLPPGTPTVGNVIHTAFRPVY